MVAVVVEHAAEHAPREVAQVAAVAGREQEAHDAELVEHRDAAAAVAGRRGVERDLRLRVGLRQVADARSRTR